MDVMEEEDLKEDLEEDLELARHPVFNPYILVPLFQSLDFHQLKNCRLICKTWNVEALRVISEKFGFGFPCGRQIGEYSINLDHWLIGSAKTPLPKLLEESEYPEYLMRNLKLRSVAGHDTEVAQCLEKYGKYVKSLDFNKKIYSLTSEPDEVPQVLLLHKLLTCWCPNVIHLELHVDLAKKGWNREIRKCDITLPLKIKSLVITECRMSDSDHYFDLRRIFPEEFPTITIHDWIISLITSSRDLKSLRILSTADESKSILQHLASSHSHNQIRKNLEVFDCKFKNCQSLWEMVSEMSSLKKLKLEVISIQFEFVVFPLAVYFDVMKNTLKHLELSGISYADADKHGFLSLLENFPNLEFVKINVFSNLRIITINLNSELKHSRPHKNLKKMLLLNNYNEISDVVGLTAFVSAFPNLEFLHLDFSFKGLNWMETRVKLPDVISILSGLNELKELVVGIYIEKPTELNEAMNLVCNFQKLHSLGIGFMNKRESAESYKRLRQNKIFHSFISTFDMCYTLDHLREPLLAAAKLKRFRLIDFIKILTQTDEDHRREILQFVEEHKIPMKFSTWGEIKKERPSLYF